jgi:anhydro-N-acetylmuramic acid kinase
MALYKQRNTGEENKGTRCMNTSLTRLLLLENKPRIIVGLMSGTSLDGLDIALCEIVGHGSDTILKVHHFVSLPYSANFLNKIRPIFANPMAPLHEVTKTNAWIAREHAHMVMLSLAKWDIKPEDVDILASHGQTIFHAPNSLDKKDIRLAQNASASLQISDGCHLAHLTQILTISDFRQKHVAAGGEGAPLVPYADFLLFTSSNENRILLNIGGIANYTYLPAKTSFSGVVSADTGPGNTLMDTAIEHAKALQDNDKPLYSYPTITKHYDVNGQFAAKGCVNKALLNTLVTALDAPHSGIEKSNQSTGQETLNLNFILAAIQQCEASDGPSFPNTEQDFYDLLATLNMFTATTIANAINALALAIENSCKHVIYISGGGVHNHTLLSNIQTCLPHFLIRSSETLGIAPDAKEAALFAVLANQTVFGDSTIFDNDNNEPASNFGKISLP